MKYIIGVFLALVLSLSAIHTLDAAYLIRLKAGSDMMVANYWVEGNYVKFEVFGGVMGIEMSQVLNITEIKIETGKGPSVSTSNDSREGSGVTMEKQTQGHPVSGAR